jgi:hypothetical protein
MRSEREEQVSRRYGQGRKVSFCVGVQTSSDSAQGALTAEQLVKLLETHGTKVTKSEAEIILEFMSRWAKILLTEYFEK